MSLRAVNLNLLPILRVLLQERSVSRAAETLGLTQPAVSLALAKLRVALNDPLLVRVGGRMELSDRAQQITGQVDDACVLLESVMTDQGFKPTLAARCFTIAARDYIQVVMAPAMTRALAAQAPDVSVQFLEVSAEEFVRSRVVNIDFAFSNRPAFVALASPELVVEPLFEDRIVMVIGRHHRLFDRAEITPDDLRDDRFLMYIPGVEFLDHRHQKFLDKYRSMGPTILRSQNINALALIAMQTGHVAVVPRRLADALSENLPLRVVGDAFGGETVELCMAWNRWRESDPAHRWFRNLIKQAAPQDGSMT